jgi:hypothetical protein
MDEGRPSAGASRGNTIFHSSLPRKQRKYRGKEVKAPGKKTVPLLLILKFSGA